MAKNKDKKTSDGIQISGGHDFTFSYADLDDEFSNANTGSVVETATVDSGFSYNLDDIGQLDMFDEMEMRDKYPALNQAYEHYQSVLEICKTKEKEENED